MSHPSEHFDTDRLRAISITEVAQRLDKVRKAGVNYVTLCPWHEDRHPSLTLYERSNENRCYCFSCGNGGDVISYVMQHEHWTFQEACQWLSNEFGIAAARGYVPRIKPRPVTKPAKIDYSYIPMAMVNELVSPENSLCQCLMRMFHPEAVKWITEEYRLGCYAMNNRDDYTVFPSIDTQERVCNLKVQHYETDPSSERFAHCDAGSCYWLGAIWAREGRLPKNSSFRSECLFGEHLLSRYPSNNVALVESPKNALFGALAFPRLLWIATGNKGMLRRDVLQPLQGRDVIVIPDCDAVEGWTSRINGMKDLANFTVSDFCLRHAPDGQPKFDIADYLQQLHFHSPSL